MAGFRFAAAHRAQVVMPQLDPEQRAIVDFSGPALSVIGAPGTGKTTALVERVAALVTAGESPDSILILAPNREAATITRGLVSDRIPVTRNSAWARTPHALAFEVLRAAAANDGELPPRLMTGSEQEQIIADLLEGHDEQEVENGLQVRSVAPPWPNDITPEIRRLRGFRHELRDLIMRCTENGVDAGGLAELAARFGRPEWLAAAQFLREYRSVLAVQGEPLVDSADVVQQACAVIERRGLPDSLARIAHILIDDVQEFTASTVALVRPFVVSGAQLVTFGDPDIATNEFRGGLPQLAADLPVHLGLPANVHYLSVRHRMPDAVSAVGDRVTARLGAALAGRQRRAIAESAARAHEGRATAVIVPGNSQMLSVIAENLRRKHLRDGVPWTDLAVIVRTAGEVEALSRGLSALGVPLGAARAGVLPRDEQASRQLLLAAGVATGVLPLDVSVATELLLGFVGGMDAIGLRRLRRHLRLDELAQGGDRSADELLVSALTGETLLGPAEAVVVQRAKRLVSIIADASRAVEQGATADEVLWSIWQRAGVSDRWRDEALGDGPGAQLANDNLDAVIALFAVAARFSEQQPDAQVAEFVQTELVKTIGDDVLLHRAAHDEVWIGTPAQAVGRQFHSVIIAGVQEGVWPNLRPRDSLLGAQAIADAVRGEAYAPSRKQTLDGELRLFYRALSRARHDVDVIAISSEDDGPSTLLALVDESLLGGEPAIIHPSSSPFTLRGMVGELRRTLVARGVDGDDGRDAAAGLARLAHAGVPGADPAQWHGLAPLSTDLPLQTPDAEHPVSVSPSTVEKFEACPLNWFLDRYGGNVTSHATAIGTIVHKAFELYQPGDSIETMMNYVKSRWGELQFEAGWQSVSAERRARRMIAKVHAHLIERERNDMAVLLREAEFDDQFGIVRLHGFIDRIERAPNDQLVIVDLKTGKSAPAQKDMPDHPQLLCYQLAIADHATLAELPPLPVGEAYLLLVGTDAAGPAIRRQGAASTAQLDEFREQLQGVAGGMGAATFVAEVEQHCDAAFGHVNCRLHIVRAVSA